MTEEKPVRTASVSSATTEVPRFIGPAAASARVDANLAESAPIDFPAAAARSPMAESRTPVLLPHALYRSIDYRYWFIAVGGGALAWWLLLNFF